MSGGDARGTRWSEEDLALLRTLGGAMSRLVDGEDVEVPDLARRDELGILANMVARLARDLGLSRRAADERRVELERRTAELSAAYEALEKLRADYRGACSPVLELFPRVLLVPIPAALDSARTAHLVPSLLDRVAETRAEAVILHLASAEPITPDVAALLLRVGQALLRAGARPILSGSARVPSSAAALTRCDTLQEALSTALDLIGYRITR